MVLLNINILPKFSFSLSQSLPRRIINQRIWQLKSVSNKSAHNNPDKSNYVIILNTPTNSTNLCHYTVFVVSFLNTSASICIHLPAADDYFAPHKRLNFMLRFVQNVRGRHSVVLGIVHCHWNWWCCCWMLSESFIITALNLIKKIFTEDSSAFQWRLAIAPKRTLRLRQMSRITLNQLVLWNPLWMSIRTWTDRPSSLRQE